jgi:predicted acetyltransferase
MSLSVAPASVADQDIIATMMVPYLAGFGGTVPYPYLEKYWSEASRHPYLLYFQEQVVGFALVRELDSTSNFELAEFYIASDFRGNGIGRQAAAAIFQSHVGIWSVGVRNDNAKGHRFWASFFASVSGVSTEEVHDPAGTVYTFTSTATNGSREA